jgi:hypothetical protein
LADFLETFLSVLFGSTFQSNSRARGRTIRAGVLMSYPLSVVLLWAAVPVACLLVFGFLVVVRPPDSPAALLGPGVVFLVTGLGGSWLWWETRNRKVLATEDAVVQVLLGGRRRRIRWRDVTRVTSRHLLGGYVITNGKVRILVAGGMDGRAMFAKQVLERVRPDAVECEHQLRDAASRA